MQRSQYAAIFGHNPDVITNAVVLRSISLYQAVSLCLLQYLQFHQYFCNPNRNSGETLHSILKPVRLKDEWEDSVAREAEELGGREGGREIEIEREIDR